MGNLKHRNQSALYHTVKVLCCNVSVFCDLTNTKARMRAFVQAQGKPYTIRLILMQAEG